MMKKILNKHEKLRIISLAIILFISILIIYGILVWNFFTDYKEFQENYYNEITNMIEKEK